jgi:glycosyltransferase involved in cell wall biosynthesis
MSHPNLSPPTIKAIFYSVLPSPYQRDLFYALSQCRDVDLQVYYLESTYSDNPWAEKELQPYESVLPGRPLTWGSSRFHLNWHLPELQKADVVVFNGYQNSIAQFILHTQAATVPCIFWGEKMVAASSGVKGKLQRLLAQGLQNCRAIAAIGSRAQQDYQRRYPQHQVVNIPYYCNLQSFSDSRQRSSSVPTILFCGQMIERKGVDLLLMAFGRLVANGINARLLLVGREADLPDMMQTLSPQAQAQVEYAGFHEPEDLPQFFAQADLFVLPSRYDGWGVVVNQALGAGLPIVCSDAVGAAVDLVEAGVNGQILPAGDSEALYGALAHYLRSPQVLQAASRAALEKAQDWTPEAGAQRWLEVLKSFKGSK